MQPSFNSLPNTTSHKKNDSKETDSSDFLMATIIGKHNKANPAKQTTLKVNKKGTNESDLSTPKSSDQSGSSNNSAVSFRSNVQMIKKVSSQALDRLGTKKDGGSIDPLLMKMKSRLVSKIEADEEQDEVNPIKIIEVADEARDEFFKERKNDAKILENIIEKTKGNEQKYLSKILLQKEGDSYAEQQNLTKKFKGLSMATHAVSAALIQAAKVEKKQIQLERDHLEQIKQAFGFDLEKDYFTANNPIDFMLKKFEKKEKGSVSRAKIVQPVQTVNRDPEIRKAQRYIRNVVKAYNNAEKNKSEHSDNESNQSSVNLDINVNENADEYEDDVLFEKSALYEMLMRTAKDPSLRSENDLKELRQIIMSLDFIKNSDCNLQPADLHEMVKYAQVVSKPRLSKIFAEGDDADSLYFVAQGTLVTTYNLAENDRKAVLLGKKDAQKNPDGFFKAIASVRMMKEAGKAAVEELDDHENNNDDIMSRRSGRSARSGYSRASRVSRARSIRSRKPRKSTFFTQPIIDGKSDKSGSKAGSASKTRNGVVSMESEMLGMIGALANEAEEKVRATLNNLNPLNAMAFMRQQVIDEVVNDYHRQVTDTKHYVMKKKEPEKPKKRYYGSTPGDSNTLGASLPSVMKSAFKRQSTNLNKQQQKRLTQRPMLNVKVATKVEIDEMKPKKLKLGQSQDRRQSAAPELVKAQLNKLKAQAQQQDLEEIKSSRNAPSISAQSKSQRNLIEKEETRATPPPGLVLVQQKSDISPPKVHQVDSSESSEGMVRLIKNRMQSQVVPEIQRDSSLIKPQLIGKDSSMKKKKSKMPAIMLGQLSIESDELENGSSSAIHTDQNMGTDESNRDDDTGMVLGAGSKPTKQTELGTKTSAVRQSSVKDLLQGQNLQGNNTSGSARESGRSAAHPAREQLDKKDALSGSGTASKLLDYKEGDVVLSNPSRSGADSQGMLNDDDSAGSFQRSETETESSGTGWGSRQSDNSCLDSICDHIREIGKTDGQPDELPLFNLGVGQYIGARAMKAAAADIRQQLKRPCSLYSRRNRVFLIEFQKDKYKKACDNAKKRAKDETLEFIKSVGLLALFTRNAQKNLRKCLKKRTLERNKMLYKEGDRADRVYFVVNGEFQVTKKIIVINKDNDGQDSAQLEQLFAERGKQRPGRGDYLIKQNGENSKQVVKSKVQVLDLVIVTSQGVLGDEDAFIEVDDHRYMTTCQCVSKSGEVYELKQEDFLRESKKLPNWNEIVSIIQEKRDKFARSVVKKQDVLKVVDQSLARKTEKTMTAKQQMDQWTDLEANENMIIKENNFRKAIKTRMLETQRERFMSPNDFGLKQGLSCEDLQFADSMAPAFQTLNHATMIQRSQSIKQTTEKTSFNRPQTNPSNAYTLNKAQSVGQFQPLHSTSAFSRADFASMNNKENASQAKAATASRQLNILQQHIIAKNTLNAKVDAQQLPSINAKTQQQQMQQTASNLAMLHKNNLTGSHRSLFNTATKVQMNKTCQMPVTQPSKQPSQSTRISIDLANICRLLPSDLKYGSTKHHSSSQTLQAREHERVMLRSQGGGGPNGGQGVLGIGSIGKQMRSLEPPMQEKKHMRTQTLTMIRDHELAMKQVKTLRKQSRKLQLSTKFTNMDSANAASHASQQAESSRATYLLRQAQIKTSQGVADQRGSYGHMIKKTDDRVQGVSALAQKISLKSQGQKSIFGGNNFSKHASIASNAHYSQMSGGQLRQVNRRLVAPAQDRD